MTNGNETVYGNSAAYPIVLPDRDYARGFTKREVFANSAPSEIPEWFEFKGEKVPMVPSWMRAEVNDEDRKILRDWQYDPVYDLPEHLMWFQDKVQEAEESAQNARNRNKVNRYFAWRTFYAEQLINALNKKEE